MRVHQVFFGLKRAFQSTLRIGRAPLNLLGLTAARFDMMYAIQRASSWHAIHQGALRQSLGVSGATISRMLGSLEKLGYVTREVDADDRRRRVVRLTEAGLECIRRARARMIDSGWAQRQVMGSLYLCGKRDPFDYKAEQEVQVLRWQLVKIRRTFKDLATLHYPPPRKRKGPWKGPRPRRAWPPLWWQHPRRRKDEARQLRRCIANPPEGTEHIWARYASHPLRWPCADHAD